MVVVVLTSMAIVDVAEATHIMAVAMVALPPATSVDPFAKSALK